MRQILSSQTLCECVFGERKNREFMGACEGVRMYSEGPPAYTEACVPYANVHARCFRVRINMCMRV